MGQSFTDPIYSANRKNNLIIAVNCGQAASTCFCTSTNTGPKVTKGYDLALTEILVEKDHYFLVETGSNEGLALLKNIPHTKASKIDLERANTIYKNAESQIDKTVDLDDIKELLYRNYDNQRWTELEEKCLACGNCTMVCPTCFCSKIEDSTDLKGEIAERWKSWDSCYSSDFSYIHGGSIRPSIKSKYRQWLMHKLATWFDQFGSSGCVGCGRCISWCPVGIDLTEEVKRIRESEKDSSNG
jgi:ferredoxin